MCGYAPVWMVRSSTSRTMTFRTEAELGDQHDLRQQDTGTKTIVGCWSYPRLGHDGYCSPTRHVNFPRMSREITMSRYLFSSHDGYGLGHVRRNVLIAREVARCEPDAEITLVTGVSRRPGWLQDPRFTVVAVPPLLKNAQGDYDNPGLGLRAAVAERARIFANTVADLRPDVVVVDRHPYGTAGELRAGLIAARRQGATILLGLRDVIDDVAAVRRELEGPGWEGVNRLFDEVLVFGNPLLCDHEREYGLPIRPTYCGWVVEAPTQQVRDDNLVVISAGRFS